jgi:hypothetical protein
MPVSAAGAAGAAGAVAPYGVMGIKPDLSKFSSVMGGGAKAMPRHGTIYFIGLLVNSDMVRDLFG